MVELFRGLLVDVPIKRIQVHNEDLDLLLTDITIKGNGLVPDNVQVKLASYSEFHLQKSPDAETSFKLRLKVDGIKPEFKGVKFSYDKKTFPQLTDKGVADINFEGNGLSSDVTISIRLENGRLSRAKIANSTVTLDSIKLIINKEKTQHDTIDSMFAPLVAGRLRTKLQKWIEEYTVDRLDQYVSQLNDWFASRPFENLKERANESLHETYEHNKEKSTTAKIEDNFSSLWNDSKSGDSSKSNEKKSQDVEGGDKAGEVYINPKYADQQQGLSSVTGPSNPLGHPQQVGASPIPQQ